MTVSRISSAGGGVLRPEELDEILAEIEGPEFERKALAALSQSATPLKRQRMVSKMLLDRWTASDGRSRNVLEVDAVDGSYRYTDTREAAYSSVYADPSLVSEVEQMWSRFESGAAPAPAVRSEGVGPPASDERAILDLLAVHYARNMLVLDLAESLRNSSPTMRFWSDSPAGMLDGVFGRLTAACPEGPEAHWTAQSHCDLTVDGVFTTRFARTQPALLEQSLSRFREAALDVAAGFPGIEAFGSGVLGVGMIHIQACAVGEDRVDQCRIRVGHPEVLMPEAPGVASRRLVLVRPLDPDRTTRIAVDHRRRGQRLMVMAPVTYDHPVLGFGAEHLGNGHQGWGSA